VCLSYLLLLEGVQILENYFYVLVFKVKIIIGHIILLGVFLFPVCEVTLP